MNISRIDEIIAKCHEQQEKHSDPNATILFKLPYRTKNKHVRLFRGLGPIGDVIGDSDTGVTARFVTSTVIAFLNKERRLELSRQIEVAKNAANTSH